MTRPLAAALALLFCAACIPSVDSGDGGQGPIAAGPAGGLFVRDGFAIDIPAGALSADTLITLVVIDTGVPDVAGRTRISLGYRFLPTSLTFSSPATLYLPWVADRVPVAVSQDSFDLRRQAGTEPVTQLPGAKTDTVPASVVEARTDRLGLFWVTSPSEPNIDHIEITPTPVTLSVGATQQFTAKVLAPTGQVIPATVAWSVRPGRVGAVDAKGQFTAAAPGTATITASAGTQQATAAVYVPGTTPGPATFVHQNPYPTGNDLRGGAIAPLAAAALAVGDDGTVLVREAAGAWTRRFSAPGLSLASVAGTSANAVAVGRRGTSGVLVELSGAPTPAVTVFKPADISDFAALWFDGSTGMGVGSGNSVALRRGGAWTTEYNPSFERLLSVLGDGNGSFVVVGDLGSIYRWDPLRAVWDSLYDTRLQVKLDAAQLVDFASGETWAAGGGKLWHFSAGAWTAQSLPGTPALTQVTALGLVDGHVLIGGAALLTATPAPAAAGVVLVRSATPASSDGGVELVSWASTWLRGPQVPLAIFGQGSTGYVVGALGATWRWDSARSALVEESHGFYGDVASLAVLPDDVYAGVNECTTLACAARGGHVLRGAGGAWTELGTFPSAEQVLAVAARSPAEVVASTASAVFTWDGGSWAAVPVDRKAGAILDLGYCGATLWAVGEGASIYAANAGRLVSPGVNAAFGGTASGLACPSPDELWVAGNGFWATRTAAGAWTDQTSPQLNQAPWLTTWSPGGGEGFVFGDSRYGLYTDGVALRSIEALGSIVPDVATGSWGASIDTLYVVGLSKYPLAFGFAARFDGVGWTLIDSGAQRKVTAIEGTGTGNLWLGTEGGGVLRGQ